MYRHVVAGLFLIAPVCVSAQVTDKLCSQITSADMSAVGATMKVKNLVALDFGTMSMKEELPGTPKALDGSVAIICTDRPGDFPNPPVAIVFQVTKTDVGLDVWNQNIAVGAKHLSDKGMASVVLKSPGQASCFVTPKVMRQNIEVEKGQAQCFGYKGKVFMQMAADDGVYKQEALAKKVKEVVESFLRRL